MACPSRSSLRAAHLVLASDPGPPAATAAARAALAARSAAANARGGITSQHAGLGTQLWGKRGGQARRAQRHTRGLLHRGARWRGRHHLRQSDPKALNHRLRIMIRGLKAVSACPECAVYVCVRVCVCGYLGGKAAWLGKAGAGTQRFPLATRPSHQQDAAKHGGAERGLEAGPYLQEAAGQGARHDRVEGILLWDGLRTSGVKRQGLSACKLRVKPGWDADGSPARTFWRMYMQEQSKTENIRPQLAKLPPMRGDSRRRV